jgi:prophage regulatory protein
MPLFDNDRLYLLREILGDPSAEPPVPAKFPVCPTTFYKLIRDGVLPEPERISPNRSGWWGSKLNASIDALPSGRRRVANG